MAARHSHTVGCATESRSRARKPKKKYKLTSEDEGTALQCEVIASNAGGSVVAENSIRCGWKPNRPLRTPNTARSDDPGSHLPTKPAVRSRLPIKLPAGLTLAQTEADKPETRVSGSGWSCVAPTVTAFTCTRSDGLGPEKSYPSITAIVHADSDTPDSIMNSATVGGGGAALPRRLRMTRLRSPPFPSGSTTSRRRSPMNSAIPLPRPVGIPSPSIAPSSSTMCRATS